MPKLHEITDPNERAVKIGYINELGAFWREVRVQTLTRITGYLFVLNAGALLGALTYVATKPSNSSIQCSIWLFGIGTLLSLLHATLDYYLTESSFSSYRKDVGEFYENKIGWNVLVDRNQKRPGFDWLLHVLGWAGGIVFIFGLAIGIPQIK
ncbi:hypothetical protein YTPLAS72_21380 [Nitrospira sp.]|nr:hypothetical protein YTPLAS72_21380 [Nitrospira sp.]